MKRICNALLVLLILLSLGVQAQESRNFGRSVIKMEPMYESYDLRNKVYYFNERDREEAKLIVKDGLLILPNGKSANFKSHGFVISGDGSIYHFKNSSLQTLAIYSWFFRRIHHSSPVNGNAVLFAGEMEVRRGKIVSISNLSGHYKPQAFETYNALSHLKFLKLDLSETLVYLYSISLNFGGPSHLSKKARANEFIRNYFDDHFRKTCRSALSI